MASEKNERLVNLTIALLATKKFLTKSQIFNAVAGYEGSPEAADRMFERDKDELRSLGIQIEMKSIDPLFDDELGYRILPERYRFNLGELTSEEVSLLALASQTWTESALQDVARSTSLRLESLGINSDFSELPLAPVISSVPENLAEILDAIESSKIIEIQYLNREDNIEKKAIEPLGLYSQKSRWYLFARDTANGGERSYRLDRIDGPIKRTTKVFKKDSVTLPTSHFPNIETLVNIRRDNVPSLLDIAEIISEDDEWINCKIEFESIDVAVAQILRYTPNIVVLQPISVVSEVTKALNELVRLHG